MSARQEAVEAMAAGRRAARERGGVDEDDVLAAALDAIPADVLARLAIEKGGMEEIGGVRASLGMFVPSPRDLRFAGPVYRLAAGSAPDSGAEA